MAQKPTTDPTQWGLREDKSSKGEGFLGILTRPDGGVMTEFSVGVPINGQEMEIPTFVPTLSADEVNTLLTLPEGTPIPKPIIQKAVTFAQQRIASGKPVWAQHGEQQSNLYPQFPRAQMQMPKIMNRTGQPTQPGALETLMLQRAREGQQ